MANLSVFRREPTADEIAAAASEVLNHEKAVSQLQSQIQSLQSQINALRAAQADHIRTINRHKGVMTLARRLPSELLARIFERCVKDGWYRAPLVVSQVCSQWRTAALAPRVWSRIYLNLDDPSAINRTRFWLRMASRAPLHVILLSTGRVPATQLLRAMELLLTHAPEWKTFKFETSGFHHVQLVTLCITQSHSYLPKLKKVSITTDTLPGVEMNGEEEETIDFADALDSERAPNLMQISLSCKSVPPLTFPSHLHKLELAITESPDSRPLAASALIALLEGLPNLTHLCISMPFDYEREYIDDGDPQGVTLPELTSLIIYGPTDLNGFLYYLHTPYLRRLHLRSLEDRGYRQDPIAPSLLHFIRDTSSFFSSSPIEVLELYDIDLSPEYFASCFLSLPNLTELRLHESSISDGTLRILQAGGDGLSGCLCPKLSKLDLRWCANLTGRALVELLRSRLPGGLHCGYPAYPMPGQYSYSEELVMSPITEVTVINCCYVEEQDILNLAVMSLCRVVVKETDYCATRRCCGNARYRQRLQMRHLLGLPADQKAQLRLII
ncbi:unnamed protein product [Somion occarium]|uniref:F-box domain-containing protein n=1 Tax=Somion occarium TaxID=3059160 RepID=A0ABP1D4R8_9APHY